MNRNYFILEYRLCKYYRSGACTNQFLSCFRLLAIIISYPSRKHCLPPSFLLQHPERLFYPTQYFLPYLLATGDQNFLSSKQTVYHKNFIIPVIVRQFLFYHNKILLYEMVNLEKRVCAG